MLNNLFEIAETRLLGVAQDDKVIHSFLRLNIVGLLLLFRRKQSRVYNKKEG